MTTNKRTVTRGRGRPTYPLPKWRIGDLLDSLRPYNLLADRLEAKGYPRLPYSSIAGWRMRGSIPASWMPAVLQIAFESRVIKDIEDLRVPPRGD